MFKEREKKLQELLANTETKIDMPQFSRPSIIELRNKEGYQIAYQGDPAVPLIMGRGDEWKNIQKLEKEKWEKDNSYQCTQLYYPEYNNGAYDRNGNVAFFLGAIEAGRRFKILNPLEEILNKAMQGLYTKDIGGCFPELVWLLSNNYTIKYEGNVLYANPPEITHKIDNENSLPKISQKVYDQDEVKTWIKKINEICEKLDNEQLTQDQGFNCNNSQISPQKSF